MQCYTEILFLTVLPPAVQMDSHVDSYMKRTAVVVSKDRHDFILSRTRLGNQEFKCLYLTVSSKTSFTGHPRYIHMKVPIGGIRQITQITHENDMFSSLH